MFQYYYVLIYISMPFSISFFYQYLNTNEKYGGSAGVTFGATKTLENMDFDEVEGGFDFEIRKTGSSDENWRRASEHGAHHRADHRRNADHPDRLLGRRRRD